MMMSLHMKTKYITAQHFFFSIGINGNSETTFIKGFVAYCTGAGFRVVVINHLGALKSEKLTGHRIFTYGKTNVIYIHQNSVPSSLYTFT